MYIACVHAHRAHNAQTNKRFQQKLVSMENSTAKKSTGKQPLNNAKYYQTISENFNQQ